MSVVGEIKLDNKFGKFLKRKRNEKGLGLNQLALYSDISAAQLSRIENGLRGVPKVENIRKLSEALDVPYEVMMRVAGHIIEVDDLSDLPTDHFTYLPVVAKISCGIPTFTEDEIIERFPAENDMLNGGEYVWLEAEGNSMINAGIKDKSKVLLRLQPIVENGEIAAVCIDEDNATLKKVYFSNDKVTLVSENPNFDDQVYGKDRVTIKGKAVYVASAL